MIIIEKVPLDLNKSDSIQRMTTRFMGFIMGGIVGNNPNYFNTPSDLMFVDGFGGLPNYYDILKKRKRLSKFKDQFVHQLDRWVSTALACISDRAARATPAERTYNPKVDLWVGFNVFDSITINISCEQFKDYESSTLMIARPRPTE